MLLWQRHEEQFKELQTQVESSFKTAMEHSVNTGKRLEQKDEDIKHHIACWTKELRDCCVELAHRLKNQQIEIYSNDASVDTKLNHLANSFRSDLSTLATQLRTTMTSDQNNSILQRLTESQDAFAHEVQSVILQLTNATE